MFAQKYRGSPRRRIRLSKSRCGATLSDGAKAVPSRAARLGQRSAVRIALVERRGRFARGRAGV